MLKTILTTTTKKDRQNPRTNGKSRAIQTKSQKGAYTYSTHKKKKRKKNLYIKEKNKKEESNQVSKEIYQ